MPLSFGFGRWRGGEFVGFGSVPNVFPKMFPIGLHFFFPILFGHHGSTSKYITCKEGKLKGRMSLREHHGLREV
jgi:hypothetical protein